MNDNQNWRNVGEQMKDALSDALQTGDFKNLNSLFSQTATNALNEAGIHIASNDERPQREQYGSNPAPKHKEETAQADIPKGQRTYKQPFEPYRPYGHVRLPHRQNRQKQAVRRQGTPPRRQMQVPRRRSAIPTVVRIKKVGRVSNILYQVFGGIGLFLMGLIAVCLLFYDLSEGMFSISGWVVLLIFLTLSFGMVRLGIVQKNRLKRASRYVQLCGSKMFEDIKRLAQSTGQEEPYVVKDLQKMLRLGMFPEGHLDQPKTCFMLNDTVYRQYLEAENSRQLREAEESKRLSEQGAAAQTPQASSTSQALTEQEAERNAMIAEGMDFIRKLKELNEQISGEAISAKLALLEDLLKDIFARVREHPEQMHRMHTLMNYYLPTTVKLVEAYEEFDQVSAPGQEILEAKAEIENTLDTINQAFAELLNNLFQDAVFDATTDAQVLKTMLAREGLMNEMDMKLRPDGGNQDEQ